jgi:pimeloyl-ACP methyl ester carboxylesterase
MSAVSNLPLPDGVAARFVEVPGGPLAVLDAAAVGTHRGTIVMLPGFTGSKEDFLLVLQPLAAAGYRVVAVDQRGQYQSGGPDDPRAYTTDALGADLLELVAALGDGPVHLVGHSFGGLVGRAAVLRDPTRFRSLVLMDSGPSALTGARADVLPFMRPILLEGGLEAVWEASQALPPHPGKPVVPDEVRDFLRARLVGGSAAGLLAMADSLTSEPDRVEELKAADVPLLVMYGEQDDAWSPAEQDDMAARLGAPVIVVPDAFHSPAVENSALTAQVLRDFLAGFSSTSP